MSFVADYFPENQIMNWMCKDWLHKWFQLSKSCRLTRYQYPFFHSLLSRPRPLMDISNFFYDSNLTQIYSWRLSWTYLSYVVSMNNTSKAQNSIKRVITNQINSNLHIIFRPRNHVSNNICCKPWIQRYYFLGFHFLLGHSGLLPHFKPYDFTCA